MNVILVDARSWIESLTKGISSEVLDIKITGSANTEDAALDLIAKHSEPIHVAIIELQLDQGTGFGIIRRLRSLARSDAGPVVVVVLTHHAVPALKVASFEAGTDYFLDKGKDLQSLLRLLRELNCDFPVAPGGVR